ncbi:MAG: DUF6108 family protein [Bacteroidales bacterium]|nr:DUF6108 family protein [Bacteroidales bacterium]
MKRLFLAIIVFLLAAAPSRAQKGLQIDSLFNGSFCPEATVSTTTVRGGAIKSYNLDLFRSIKFSATDREIEKVSSWIAADSKKASMTDIDRENGRMVYALLWFEDTRNDNRYVGYQLKETDDGTFITVVYLTGKASIEQLKKFFGK